MSETFQCKSRHHTPSSPGMPTEDTWRTRPDGSRTCSFCGSLHEEDMLDILEHYANGDAGYYFDITSKDYKFYANRPGVKNASDGGIKYYTWHHTDENLERRKDTIPRAIEHYHRVDD